mmetsp:Transcript_42611/g.49805  ORF Transcript_42611/g.49805 Transcript_42611/m.49805 type:complete len:83 (-) Transcript_42611:170-418(-)
MYCLSKATILPLSASTDCSTKSKYFSSSTSISIESAFSVSSVVPPKKKNCYQYNYHRSNNKGCLISKIIWKLFCTCICHSTT